MNYVYKQPTLIELLINILEKNVNKKKFLVNIDDEALCYELDYKKRGYEAIFAILEGKKDK